MEQLASSPIQCPIEAAQTFNLNNLKPTIRGAFPKLKAFNNVQQTVAKTVLQTDDSIVVNAPTGSGKTVILELAMLKLAEQTKDVPYRIVYIAPTRSLCAEKFQDWKVRFAPHGISCIQFDGDNLVEDVTKLSAHRLILSTPEKWEVFTRHWDDQNVASVLRPIRLCLIDEIQTMNDSDRGANLELVVSRMKYIDARLRREDVSGAEHNSIRFIAVSACIPNVDDFARWLANGRSVVPYTFDETNRTTRIERHVLSFPCATNPYKFELNLNYKLPAIIEQHCGQKPTLIFCTSRKSVESTAKFLAKSAMKRIVPAGPALHELAANLANRNLQDCVTKGIAYHHAGLLQNDRHQIETHFRAGHLAVLCCTSTLCMGVNLPAYLVIVKSTFNHTGKDYSDNYVLQMIGRAGRAEFSEDGVAIILTTDGNSSRYQKVVTETVPIESQLHRKLPELLNSEITHGIIYDQPAVMEWIKSTFFYVRAQTNPAHYKLSSRGRLIEEEIEKLCNDTIESLEANELIIKQRSNAIVATACGRLMARNQLSFQTMKLLQQDMQGRETLDEMLVLITRAQEFCDFKCRQGEKKILNTLNGPNISAAFCDGGDDLTSSIRFRWPRRISTTGAKVYCLVQAVFGNLTINDHGLHQEAAKIVTLGGRIARFVVGLLAANRAHFESGCFRALVSVTTLLQCFQTKLWEDSPFLTKQLGQIGPRLARHLADRGKVTFQAVRNSDPREIECILKKQPPFGNDIVNYVSGLPVFTIELKKVEAGHVPGYTCTVVQKNMHYDPEISVSFSVLVGDSSNKVLLHLENCTIESIPVMGCTWPLKVSGDNTTLESLSAHLICHNWCGLDCSHTLWLKEQPPTIAKHRQTAITSFFPNTSVNESTIGSEKIVLPSALELSRLRLNESFIPENQSFLPGKSRYSLDAFKWNETCNDSGVFKTSHNNTTLTTNEPTLAETSSRVSAMLDTRQQNPPELRKPLRSILKPISSVLPVKPPPIVPLNISAYSLIANNQDRFRQGAKFHTTPVLFRTDDELQYIFQPDRCSLNFTLCSPVDDILDCLQRYSMFIADRCTLPEELPETQPQTARVERKRKNFDLGSAADVFVSDEEQLI
uniref:DNA 3'-5' helicase n=1 Tax=Anopheles christyi TaxID=43041 RepID=A0A182JXB3_9DIPT